MATSPKTSKEIILFMIYEIYLKSNLKKPILSIYYKTYKGAFNRILTYCKKPITNDYQKMLTSNSILMIRDDMQHILADCVYNEQTNEFLIVETDNIGHEIKRTTINH